MWVVLLGPDGAGKTSVVHAIGDGASAGFDGCEAFHLRPRLIGKSPASEANSNPHGKPMRLAAVTLVKMFFLLAANWLAYLLVVLPRRVKGELVLFDRYFPDALVDPMRYRIPASCARLVKAVADLIPQPDLYVVLDAPANLTQERKYEVAANEAERQRRQYRRLPGILDNCVVVNASGTVGEVVDRVLERVVERHLGELVAETEVA
jgi:thymidylate kinase